MEAKPQRQRRKRVTKKTTTTTTPSGQKVTTTTTTTGPKKRRARRQRRTVVMHETPNGQAMQVIQQSTQQQIRRMQKQIRRIKKCEDGPKVQDMFETTLTIGPVFGIDQDDLVKQQRLWLNPVLLKPTNSGANPTPLTKRASQYTLYKLMRCDVKLSSLVGNSNISGTQIVLDLDQEGSSAKPDTIDTIKARPHIQATVGQSKTWKIPLRQLLGPREGWWHVDTNEDATFSLGPAINVSVFLQTMNLLNVDKDKTQTYTGPIALLELTVKYAFSGYNPKPALQKLKRELHVHSKPGAGSSPGGKFVNGPNGEVMLEIETNSVFWSAMQEVEYASGSEVRADNTQKSKSATLWALGSEAVGVIAPALGPFGWLLRGGWWVLRRIFDPAAAAQGSKKETYAVYASVEDAQKDMPIRTAVSTDSQKNVLPSGKYHFTQINSDNLLSDTTVSPAAAAPVVVYGGDFLPIAYAPLPDTIPEFIYEYDEHDGYTPGYVGLYLPPIGYGAMIDATMVATGFGVWHFVGQDSSATAKSTLAMTIGAGRPDHQTWDWKMSGRYLNYFEFGNHFTLLGLNDLRRMAMFHTPKTTLWTIKHAHLRLHEDGNPGKGAPSQVVLWNHEWSTTPTWTAFLKEMECFGTDTAVIPMRIQVPEEGVGSNWVANDIEGNHDDVNPESYPNQMHANCFLLITPETNQIGLLFTNETKAQQLKHKQLLMAATNIQKKERWDQKQHFWTYDEWRTEIRDTIHVLPSTPPNSDEEDSKSDSDYEVIKKKKNTTKQKK